MNEFKDFLSNKWRVIIYIKINSNQEKGAVRNINITVKLTNYCRLIRFALK